MIDHCSAKGENNERGEGATDTAAIGSWEQLNNLHNNNLWKMCPGKEKQ